MNKGENVTPRYAVRFTRAADKQLVKLDMQTQRRIVDALDDLAGDPQNAANVKAMKGRDALRLRVGSYRVIYEINDGALVVLVLRIGHRREAYR